MMIELDVAAARKRFKPTGEANVSTIQLTGKISFSG